MQRSEWWYAMAVVTCTACAPADRAAGDSSAAATDSAGASPVAPKPSPTSPAPNDTPLSWTVNPNGVRGVRVGMRSADVRTALGLAPAPPFAPGTCEYLDASALPVRLYFMTKSDTLVRIDVRDSTLATREGARVGDSEARIKSVYGSAVRIEPHKYTGPKGHYLVVTPANDTTHLIIFETDGERVTMFRVGRKPEVSYVEGCS